MKSLDGRNNVTVYNLSAGKALPEWLTDRKRRQLSKRDVEFRRRIELIQDFTMPDVSGCVRVSPDGRYILATGTYKPRVKCYEVAALSLKFERCFDAEVVQFNILSDDYSKLAFLQEDRYLEFHSQGGRWFRTRIPKFGRDMAYHYPSCDLYVAASGSEVYRLNLNQGRFLNSLQTGSTGVNKCTFNRVHYLFAAGTEDGRVEAWDPRSRHRVGLLDCALHLAQEQINNYSSVKQLGVSALAFNDALTLGVGMNTGQVMLYDIRSDKPLLVKDHNDGFPIKNVEFHSSTNYVVSMSSKMVKIWDKNTGQGHTSIESGVDLNDLCVVPHSGMIFLATEDPKMQTYFLPSLGPAPKWCSHLDALIEELEEEEAPPQYDDYKFVTEQELQQLGLHDLIGSNTLRAVMHGYYMDVRLYNKAKLIANPFDLHGFMKRKVKQKISEENQRGIQAKKLPDVNQALFERLLEDQEEEQQEQEKKRKRKAEAGELLADSRFTQLFSNADFEIDKESYEFRLLNPVLSRMDKKKKKKRLQEEEEEKEFVAARQAAEMSDTSDSLDSDFGEDDQQDTAENETNTKGTKEIEKRTAMDNRKEKSGPLRPESAETKTRPVRPGLVEATARPKQADASVRSLQFTAVDSLTDLKATKKKLGKLSLGERLGLEEEDPEAVKQHSFGSREMNYVIKREPKYERLRQQQKEHHQERRKVHRSTGKLRGKLRATDPFI